MTAPDFDRLTADCNPILTSTFDNDPAAHANHEWLAATCVEGSTVHAVIHHEFHGYEAELADSQRDILDFGDPPAWEVTITGRTSERTSLTTVEPRSDEPVTPAT